MKAGPAGQSSHAVITGAAGGIGAALAAHFIHAGWRVTGIDIKPSGADLPGAGRFRGVVADITDEAAMQAAMDDAWAAAPVSAVISNAAVTDIRHHRVVDLPLSVWESVLRVNVDGAFITARAAARHMVNQRAGNIVFVTSSLARLSDALPGDAPYCTAKAAVEMLARVLAKEVADDGVNVNTLFPSVKIDTGFFAHLDASERADLAPPTILNETAMVLATQPPGAVTGESLDQQRWDEDEVYRQSWQSGRGPG